MSGQDPGPVAEYVDGNGNTWQLNETDAKRLGYERVEAKVIETPTAATKPPAKRTATTK